MKHIVTTLCFLLVSYFGFAQTQHEMNVEVCNENKKSDSTLNSVFRLVKQKFKDDTLFVRKLTEAQKAWVQFRDAEMNALFPHWDDRQQYYGTMFTMCWCSVEADLTNQRVKILRLWLDGVEEDGDGCHGSVPWKQ